MTLTLTCDLDVRTRWRFFSGLRNTHRRCDCPQNWKVHLLAVFCASTGCPMHGVCAAARIALQTWQ